MKLTVMNETGKGSEMDVSDAVYGARFNEALIHQAVTAYQAGGRQGSRAQKTRSQVRGGGAKPWRQKGTGRARAGTIRSPIWRGGGRTFPASPSENFVQKVNKKMNRVAMRSVLSELLRQQRLVSVPELKLEAPKTKELLAVLKKYDAANVLIVIDSEQQNLALAARNIPHVDVRTVPQADIVSLVSHDKVLLTGNTAKRFEELLA